LAIIEQFTPQQDGGRWVFLGWIFWGFSGVRRSVRQTNRGKFTREHQTVLECDKNAEIM